MPKETKKSNNKVIVEDQKNIALPQNVEDSKKKKAQEYLSTCLDYDNHDDLALMWQCITNEKIYCIDVESYDFYQFDKETLIYKLIGINQFTEIVKNDLKSFLQNSEKEKKALKKQLKDLYDDSDIKEDKRCCKLIQKICMKAYSTNVAQVAANKIYDLKFFANLDTNKRVVNFKNGLVDLQTGEFRVRSIDDTDCYSKCLDYDYFEAKTPKEIEVEQKLKAEIISDLDKICNNSKELLDFILSFLGYCLTGETKEQKSLFILGHMAANGKSTLFKIFEQCFGCYCLKMDKETFTEGNPKVHKMLALTKGIRACFLEELSKKKIDGDLWKDLVDGHSKNNEVLFGTMEKLIILFKIICLTNHLPNFNGDRGVLRRGMLVSFNNIFVDEEDYDAKNPVKGTYKKDKNVEDKFRHNNYRNAFFKILVEHSKKYYETGLYVYKPAKEDFKNLCAENDKMNEFIEKFFIVSDENNEVIYKDIFMKMYNSHYKVNLPCMISILSDAKRCGLIYDKDQRIMVDGMSQKGVFRKLKLKVEIDDVEDGISIEQSIKPTLDEDIENLTKRLESLKQKKIAELETKLKDHLESKNKTEISKKGMDRFLVKKETSESETEIEPYGDVEPEPESEDERPVKKAKKVKKSKKPLEFQKQAECTINDDFAKIACDYDF